MVIVKIRDERHGEAKYVLGIEITRDYPNKLLTLSQGSYLETMLKRFDRVMCKLPFARA